MRVKDVPVGATVRLAAVPSVRASVVRHGDMATVVRVDGDPVVVNGREIPRRVTGLWSGETEVELS